MASVFVLHAKYDVDHDNCCEEEFVVQLASALQCIVVQTTTVGTFLVSRGAASSQSPISVSCHAHGETKLAFELIAHDPRVESDGESDSSPAVSIGEPNVRIYGETILQRIPFGALPASKWSPIAVSTQELVAYGVADAEKVLQGAQLTVCSGSVILEVRNATCTAHAQRIAEWALKTPMLAEVVEAAVMIATLQPLLRVNFFAHNLSISIDEVPLHRSDDGWFLTEPIWIDSMMSDASGQALPGMIQRATQTLFPNLSSSADDLFVLFASPSLPFVNELAPSDAFWNLLVASHAAMFRKTESQLVQDCPAIVQTQLAQRSATCKRASFLQPTTKSMLIVGARREEVLRAALAVTKSAVARAPRDDLPAINSLVEVAVDVNSHPNARWRCIMQDGGRFDRAKRQSLVRLASRSSCVEVVDLCDTTGIDCETVQTLLDIAHVRVVAVAGTAQLGSIVNRFRGNSKLVFLGKPAFFDLEQRDACFDLHNRFYAFQFAVKALVVPSLK